MLRVSLSKMSDLAIADQSHRALIPLLAAHRDVSDIHVHTRLTDGKNTVQEMADAAVNKGLRFLVFSEHVRRITSYDYTVFKGAVEQCRRPGFTPFAGSEAKILDESGLVDMDDSVSKMSALRIASFHGEGFQRGFFLKAAHAVLENSSVDVWGHPFSTGLQLEDADWTKLFDHAGETGIAIEISSRYPMPHGVLALLKKSKAVYLFGSDAHVSDEIRRAV